MLALRARTALITVCLCGILPAVVRAAPPAFDPNAVLAEAESAFAQGKATDDPVKARAEFARAAMLYAQLRGTNPWLHLNEGNAQLLAGQLPDAILAYHRGLRLAPNERRLRENLECARQRIVYPGERGRPPASAWPGWLPRPATELLVVVAGLFYALGCIAVTRWLMVRPSGGLFRAGLLLAFALGVACVAYLRVAEAGEEDRHPFVVVAAEAPFQRGNGESYARHPDLPLLPPGLEGRRLHERGDWLQIQLASGEIGWIRREQILVDER